MSWHCSLEAGEDFSLQNYLGGIRSERLRSRSIQEKCCCKDNAMECSTSSQSGTMFAPSTASPGVDSLMLFRGDFPVKTSVQRVKAMDLPVSVLDCGLNISESLKRYGLKLCSSKTHRTCEPVDSAPSSKDLPAWGMTYAGECWELGTSVRHINETECGLWPTPVASDTGVRKAKYAQGGTALSMAASMFPTPTTQSNVQIRGVGAAANHPDRGTTLAGYISMFPTPTVQDAKNNGGPSQMERNTPPLNAVVGGSLNPDWVEKLMGWPKGWTSLEPMCKFEMILWKAGFTDAKEDKRITETMRALQESDVSGQISKSVGGFVSIQETAILFAELCKQKRQVDKAWLFMACEKAFEDEMRSVRELQKTPGTPCRPRNIKQLTEQYPNALQAVSRLLAFYGKEAWAEGCWEDAMPRTCHGIASRVDRLKAIGNGQVPAVAAAAYRILDSSFNTQQQGTNQ